MRRLRRMRVTWLTGVMRSTAGACSTAGMAGMAVTGISS